MYEAFLVDLVVFFHPIFEGFSSRLIDVRHGWHVKNQMLKTVKVIFLLILFEMVFFFNFQFSIESHICIQI
jgi:hypothetical protein